MKVRNFFSMIIMLIVVLALVLTGCTKQPTEKSQTLTETITEESVGSETSSGNQTLSKDGVTFSELTLIPDRAITVKVDNTSRIAKEGYVSVACLDNDGLQLERKDILFEINALTNDIIQETRIPDGTVSVKFLRTTVVDK